MNGTTIGTGLLARIIPCLDVRAGRVVKGVRFQNLRDSGDPVALASAYEEQGADELTLLDVSATPDDRKTAAHTVAAVRRVLGIPLTVGGGIRSEDDAARLLDAGADKVGVNSAAVTDPDLLSRLAARFGRQCVVLSIDAARDKAAATPTYHVVTRSGTNRTPLNAVEWAARGESLGAGEILLTSMDQDGTLAGYDLDLLRAVSRAVNVPVIASGGASGPQHMVDALRAGADAVLAASIFHDGHWTVASIKSELARAGLEIRL